jgi:hypothetical protein
MENDIKKDKAVSEIDRVVAWVNILSKEKKKVILPIVIFGLLGVLVALISPRVYVSKTTMMPETSGAAAKMGNISSLAAMAGFNIDMSGSEELSPAVYPQITSSAPYLLELINSTVVPGEGEKEVTLLDWCSDIKNRGIWYILKQYTIGLPGKIFGGKEKTRSAGYGNTIRLTNREDKIINLIKKNVTLEVDQKYGFLTLSAAFSNAEVAAQVAEKARELLQKYVTQYKIRKASDKMEFIEGRYNEKKSEFIKAQQNLASFRDRNRNVSGAVAATEEDRLRGEFNIAQSVYNELAKQLEQAKIQVKEDTPVFSVIQPATVPNKAERPKRAMIVLMWGLLGVIVGVGRVLMISD